MAFNPFNWFRKHQKVVFAGLIILCMIVFIMQFGRGDLFETLLGWIGQRGSRGPVAATLSGKAVSEADLVKLSTRRKAANDFLVRAVGSSAASAAGELARPPRKEDENKEGQAFAGLRILASELQRDLLAMQELQSGRRSPNWFQALQRAEGIPIRVRSYLEALPNRVTSFLESKEDGKGDREAFLAAADKIGALIGFVEWTATNRGGQLYLGGDTTADSLLDFIIWQQQADKLGIVLTDADVMREINTEAAGVAVFDPKVRPFERESLVTSFLAERAIKAPELLDALREEFRVAMAKSLLLGVAQGGRAWKTAYAGTPNSNPAVGTPHEFLQFYRERRTTMKVTLVPVAAEPFLADVKGTPPEADLLALFDKYRTREPSPYSREPGFKEPRRIRAEYVIGSADSPYFAGKSRDLVFGTPARPRRKPGEPLKGLLDTFATERLAWDSFLYAGLSPLGGPSGRAGALALLLAADPFQAAHGKYLEAARAAQPLLPSLKGESFRSDLARPESTLNLASALNRRQMAALVGQRLLAGNPGELFGATMPLYEGGTLDDDNAPVRQALSAILAPALAGGHFESLIGGQALVMAHRFTKLSRPLAPVGREILEPVYLGEFEKSLAASLMLENMQTLAEKVEKYKGKDAPAAGALAKESAALHLDFHQMPGLMTGPQIIDQMRRKGKTGLEALRKEMERTGPVTPEALTGWLLGVTVPFQPQALEQARAFSGAFTPWDPRVSGRETDGKPRVMLWVAAEEKARDRGFSEVASEVKDAWRMDQARFLAQALAVDVAGKINAKELTPQDALRVLADARAAQPRIGEPFQLSGVAELIPPSRENLPLRRSDYTPYKIEGPEADLLPYPPVDPTNPDGPTTLPRLLLEMKRPGAAMVIADRPARTFYIAVLENRFEPSVSELGKVYAESPKSDSLYGDFRLRKQIDYARGVMEQLRRDAAGKLTADGRIEIDPEVRKRFSGRQGPMDE